MLWVLNQGLPVQGSGTNFNPMKVQTALCAEVPVDFGALLRNGHQPLPVRHAEATPVELAMSRQSATHRCPFWEFRGISVQYQYRMAIHDVLVGGPRGKTPAVKDSMRTIWPLPQCGHSRSDSPVRR